MKSIYVILLMLITFGLVSFSFYFSGSNIFNILALAPLLFSYYHGVKLIRNNIKNKFNH